jgi:N-acetylglucosamine-6-phosphate deacetylase
MIAIRMQYAPSTSWTITGTVLRGWRLTDGQVHIADGEITAAAPRRARRLRLAEGWTLAPGFWDIQVNGFAGAEVGDDPDQLRHVAEALPAHGVTGFCPTLVTRTPAAYRRAQAALATAAWPARGARNLGVHLEGPFLAPSRAGAHPGSALALPTPERVARLADAFSPRIFTLAPELAGADRAIARLHQAGVIVAIGHTEATAPECTRALAAGARVLTHAFNAMPGVTARDPGPVGAFLAAPDAYITVIADGVHVAPQTLGLLARAAGHHLVLISDAVVAAGAPPGEYLLSGRRIASDGAAVRDRAGRLAGSALPLSRGPRELTQLGRRPADALGSAISAPRRLLGAPDPLAPGAPADLVVLDERLQLQLTLIGGEVVWRHPAGRLAEI